MEPSGLTLKAVSSNLLGLDSTVNFAFMIGIHIRKIFIICRIFLFFGQCHHSNPGKILEGATQYFYRITTFDSFTIHMNTRHDNRNSTSHGTPLHLSHKLIIRTEDTVFS